jgi:GT2 family glycosyltransferase
MLSLIICSKQGDISGQLKTNITDTIGVPYELIVIDNSKNDHSIFSAYNEGVKKASNDFLCFMHEDVFYHSKDWGKSVVEHLLVPDTGLIGLAGSYYLLPFPSMWSDALPMVLNLIQSPLGEQTEYFTINADEKVICVDGFWFCSRKNVFEQVAFDESTFNHFHFYDLDISLQIHEKGYSILVVSDIKVEHFSQGSVNSQWIDAAYLFYEKWEKQLPITINPKFKKKFLTDTRGFKNILYAHRKNNYPIPKKLLKIGWRTLKLNILTAYLLLYRRIIINARTK